MDGNKAIVFMLLSVCGCTATAIYNEELTKREYIKQGYVYQNHEWKKGECNELNEKP